MGNQMTAQELKEMFLFVAGRVVENEEHLTEIDGKIGDGDHGTGMAMGFREILRELPACEA